MAVTTKWVGLAVQGLFSATAARRFDWVNDTFKITLHTGTVPNQDTVDFADDLANEVANGNGYTTGGVTLGTKALTYDTASNTVRLDCADPSWTFSASKTAAYAVVIKDTGSAATSPVVGYIDFGGDQTSSSTFTIQVDATDGLFRGVVS
jgi:hypothetical protein